MSILTQEGQSRVAPQKTSIGAYTFLNAKIAYEPSLFGDVRFAIRGRNLTNSAARPHTSFIKYVAPLPGRDVEFYVEATF
jgi:iron complex outermembrane receptor protein